MIFRSARERQGLGITFRAQQGRVNLSDGGRGSQCWRCCSWQHLSRAEHNDRERDTHVQIPIFCAKKATKTRHVAQHWIVVWNQRNILKSKSKENIDKEKVQNLSWNSKRPI